MPSGCHSTRAVAVLSTMILCLSTLVHNCHVAIICRYMQAGISETNTAVRGTVSFFSQLPGIQVYVDSFKHLRRKHLLRSAIIFSLPAAAAFAFAFAFAGW